MALERRYGNMVRHLGYGNTSMESGKSYLATSTITLTAHRRGLTIDSTLAFLTNGFPVVRLGSSARPCADMDEPGFRTSGQRHLCREFISLLCCGPSGGVRVRCVGGSRRCRLDRGMANEKDCLTTRRPRLLDACCMLPATYFKGGCSCAVASRP